MFPSEETCPKCHQTYLRTCTSFFCPRCGKKGGFY